MSHVLAAAALVAAQTLPDFWRTDNSALPVTIISKHAQHISTLHLVISSQTTVQELLDLVESNHHNEPSLTIIFVESENDLQTTPTEAPNTLIVMQDTSGTLHIRNSTLSKDPTTWLPHRLLTSYHALLNATPSTLLPQLSTVSPSERDLLLGWSRATPPNQSDEHELFPTIHNYFERAAEKTPDAIALQWENTDFMTYRSLDRHADALASYLVHQLHVERGESVLCFFDRGFEMIIAILAIIKAGAAYIPLDINHPAERTRTIQSLSGARLCLSSTPLIPTAQHRLGGEGVVDITSLLPTLLASPIPPLGHTPSGDDLCYIMFTSGSTGVPKGVMVPHSAVVSSVIDGPEYTRELREWGPKLRTLMFSNYAFDYSVWDIFLTLTSSGTLCLAPKSSLLNDLEGTINSLQITFLETTPTVLSLLSPSTTPTLEMVFTSGEALTRHVRDTYQPTPSNPLLRLGNGGAPTETTIMSVFTPITPKEDPNTYGRPFGGNRVYVLGSGMEWVPPGVVGTLWIGGPQVSLGYLGQPELTLQVFRGDPFEKGGRVYDTGDLCCWDSQGRLRYWGRGDGQVKVRGQRVEVGEVVGALRGCEGVVGAGVVKYTSEGGREEVVGFVKVKDVGVDVGAIRKAVSSVLPVYMVPSAIIPVTSLPMTLNGKLDLRALQQLAAEHFQSKSTSSTSVQIPRTGLLAVMASIWSTVLSLSSDIIQDDDDFYELGGDSISAIRVASQSRAAGYSLHVQDFTEARTIKAQAELMSRRGAAEEKERLYQPFELLSSVDYRETVLSEAGVYGYGESGIEDAYPCTSYIAGLVSLAAGNPQSYMAHYTFERKGSYDRAQLQAAWGWVIQRHPILRTMAIVAPKPYNEIVQVVINHESFPLDVAFSQHADEAGRDEAVDAYIKQTPGFAWGRVPTRLAIFEGPTTCVMTWQVHHSQYDGWSYQIILDDLHAAYGMGSPAPPHPPPPYSHFVRWAKEHDTPSALGYWKTVLKGSTPLTWPKLSNGTPTTDVSLTRNWSKGHDLASFCSKERLTISSCVRTALALVLGMYGNSDDVVFGVVTSGRAGALSKIETIVGPCISTYPCRVQVPADSPIMSVLESVHKESMASILYQCVGLNDISRTSAISGPRGLFGVLLTIENLPGLSGVDHPLVGRNVRGHRLEFNYALSLTVFISDDSDLQIQFDWDSRCLTPKDIEWFSKHLFSTLSHMMSCPTQMVHQLNMVSPEEVVFLHDIAVGQKLELLYAEDAFFHVLVDETAVRHSQSPAIDHTSGVALSYATLVQRANQVAHGLQARGVMPETLVPVLYDKYSNQTEAVIAFLGIMKAGGAFVPLDSSWPVARLSSCIRQTSSEFLICDSATPEVARALSTLLVTVDVLSLDHECTTPLVPDLKPNSLAYVEFTSGTTGEPKGVMIEHRHIISLLNNLGETPCVRGIQRMLHICPWSFDVGLMDIFLAFTVGATLVLADMVDIVSDMSKVLLSTHADTVSMTPTLAGLAKSNIHYPYLRNMFLAGEKVPSEICSKWRAKTTLIEWYGPTEVTVVCIGTNHSVEGPSQGVIGKPHGSMRAYVLDSAMNLLPVGATGELYLAGNQVGRGYLNLPEITAAAFVPNPFNPADRLYKSGDLVRWTSDGQIEYVGRREGGTIKLRGLRVEIAEVEAALMSVESTLAVVQLVDFEGQQHLVAFLSKSYTRSGTLPLKICDDLPSHRPHVRLLRDACRRSLPTYAIPTLWLFVDAMPLGMSNKIDRKQLRALFDLLSQQDGKMSTISLGLFGSLPHRLPKDIVEETLLRLWLELLRSDVIQVHDDWVDHGVDSVKSITYLAMVKRHGWNLSIKDFYEARTVARLAAVIRATNSLSIDHKPCSSDLKESDAQIFQIMSAPAGQGGTELWFIHDGKGILGPEYGMLDSLGCDVFGISNSCTDERTLVQNYPTVEAFVTRYFPLLPPTKNIYLAGWSSGGNIALAIAARRKQLGMPIAGVIMLDSFNLGGCELHLDPVSLGVQSKPHLLRMHLTHISRLLTFFMEPYFDGNVLLIQAGTGRDRDLASFQVTPKGDIARNLWTENLGKMEIIQVPESTHSGLMTTPHGRKQTSSILRAWCK